MAADNELPAIHHLSVNAEWLERVQEDVLDATLPIIDPHHHLWKGSSEYLLDGFSSDLATGHAVVATVFVQCGFAYREGGLSALRPVGETDFVAAVAQEAIDRGLPTKMCAGIVGFADLTLGDDLDEVLIAHIDAGKGRFRGIRHPVARDDSFIAGLLRPAPRPQLLLDTNFRQGLRRLAAYDLTFDAWLYHPQMIELIELARACPEVTIVLDHVGAPLGVGPYKGKRDQVFSSWLESLTMLAACENVHVKLGGLGMAISAFDFHEHQLPPSSTQLASAWRPYIEACIERFGVQRCMFESNFPVDKGTCSYQILWNAYKRIASGASADEMADLFHNTAARVYHLDLAC